LTSFALTLARLHCACKGHRHHPLPPLRYGLSTYPRPWLTAVLVRRLYVIDGSGQPFSRRHHYLRDNRSHILPTVHQRPSRGGGVEFLAEFVRPSVFPHDISKTDAGSITKLDTKNIPPRVLEIYFVQGYNVKGQGNESQKERCHTCNFIARRNRMCDTACHFQNAINSFPVRYQSIPKLP